MSQIIYRPCSTSLMFIGLLLFCSLVAACGKAEVVLEKREVPAQERLRVSIRPGQEQQGLTFRWRADRGICDPQLSPNLSTMYIAPAEPGDDHITVEVFQDGKPLYEVKSPTLNVTAAVAAGNANKSVTPEPSPASSATSSPTVNVTSRPQIIIKDPKPPYDPVGGPDTSADITGAVTGLESPTDFKIVIYAWTNMWYVQPLIAAPYTDISTTGQWAAFGIHTGSKYAVLLVKPSFQPPATTFTLPAGEDVLASETFVGNKP